MGFLKNRYNKEGPGVPKDAPRKKGLSLFFEILFREFWQLIKLNMLFILVSIPLVTIPPALAGMTYVIIKMIRDENTFVWSDFWKGFKENVKSAYILGVIFLVVSLSIGSSIFIAISENRMIFSLLALALNILAGVFLISAFPMIVGVDIDIKSAIKNSVILGISCINYNLPALIISEGIMIALVLYFPISLPIFFFIAFAFCSLVTCFAAWAGIKKYVIRDKDATMAELETEDIARQNREEDLEDLENIES